MSIVIAEMMDYARTEFGASPSYIGPGGLTEEQGVEVAFRAQRANHIRQQKILMQEMVKRVAEQRTLLWQKETKHRPSSARSRPTTAKNKQVR